LIQDSGAVVIGAMLVAPLMMPMIGAGLSLVQGNRALLREAVRSILVGFFTALAIGLACGLAWRLLEPEGELTGQILSRGSPGALDLVVAFLSGLAAAYAVARPGLMGAMAGVAVAAALVPPIGSAGIALAKGQTGVGQGAALLFGTNLVAIVLGAGGAFRLIGVHPPKSKAGGGGRLWVRRVVFGLVLTAVGLFFGFVGVLVTQVAEDGGSGFGGRSSARSARRRASPSSRSGGRPSGARATWRSSSRPSAGSRPTSRSGSTRRPRRRPGDPSSCTSSASAGSGPRARPPSADPCACRAAG